MSPRIENPIVTLNNVRLSYPSLFEPKQDDQDPSKKPKFEATFILDKKANAVEIKAMQAAIELVKKHPTLKGKKPTKVCLREGDDTEARAEAEGYGAGVMSVGARNHKRPGVVNRDLSPLVESDGKPYAGCYVNGRIEVYPYVHPKSGPGIAASLRAVQFFRDGPPFGDGAPIDAEKEFSAVEDESVV